MNRVTFRAGDVPRTYSATVNAVVDYTPLGGSRTEGQVSCSFSIEDYSFGNGRRIAIDASVISTTDINVQQSALNPLKIASVTAYSTKSALGEPLYFDLDIGEAYKEEDGEIVSVNNAVSFPTELPTLKPGANNITFDNTVQTLKIVPRWWKV